MGGSLERDVPFSSADLYLPSGCAGSLNYVSWKQRKAVAADLKPIYRASTVEEAGQRLDEFVAKWDASYPTGSQTWRRNWEHLTPFFAGGRSQSYLCDRRGRVAEHVAAESDQDQRLVSESGNAYKLLYLALEHIAKKWTMPIQNWKAALQHFAILLGDRVPRGQI
jgi:putative transposase